MTQEIQVEIVEPDVAAEEIDDGDGGEAHTRAEGRRRLWRLLAEVCRCTLDLPARVSTFPGPMFTLRPGFFQ